MRTVNEKFQLLSELEHYLSSKGINTRKPFRCLNPNHEDRNPSMGFDRKRNHVHCFACGADYDIIDLIGLDYGLDNKEAFKRAKAMFSYFGNDWKNETYFPKRRAAGVNYTAKINSVVDERESSSEIKIPNDRIVLNISPYRDERESSSLNQIPDPLLNSALTVKNSAVDEQEKSSLNQIPYIARARKRLENTDYHLLRGISRETAERYGLGFDESFSSGLGKAFWRALIIPTGEGSFTARNTDINADSRNKVRKSGKSRFFNLQAAFLQDDPIFVVEGEFDALSLLEIGANAVSLGSTANVRRFMETVCEKNLKTVFLVAMDNDSAGEMAKKSLLAGFEERNIPAVPVDIHLGEKDANDALLKNRQVFQKVVFEALEQARKDIRQQGETEKAKYLKNSAAARLPAFLESVRKDRRFSAVSTGFSVLDELLDGGLYEGLYIIGAISSLGKTTLINQIACHAAEKETDVLIFSLEMSERELTAKNLSRLTLECCLSRNMPVSYAKTVRGILNEHRFSDSGTEEKEVFENAVKAYQQLAEKIFIIEGVGVIGAEQIRDTVKKHVELTGNTPLVIVDYLQILMTENAYGTDKQHTDRAVLELKRISQDFHLPLLVISSFNRQNYKEAVTMEAFKESGAIEYSSDVLIGLQLKGAGHKDFDAGEEKKKNPRQIELKILKNRNGITGGQMDFDYYPGYHYFKEK